MSVTVTLQPKELIVIYLSQTIGAGVPTPDVIDGGDPSTTSTDFIDGGTPSSTVTDFIDGGTP